jgi:opacity protein-like surface antigen
MKTITSKALVITGLAFISLAPTKGESLSIPKSGFYIGAALGGADLTAKSNSTLIRPLGLAAPLTQNIYLTSTDKNIAGDIFAGYEKNVNYFWLAGEIVGSFAPLKSTLKLAINTSNPPLEIKTTSALGGALKLGYYISATHKLYLKMGFELRRFKVNFTDSLNLSTNLNRSYNSTAFVPGLGMEVDLTPRFSLRMEYRVALHYKKTTQTMISAIQSTTVQIQPTIHYLNLGLVFKM